MNAQTTVPSKSRKLVDYTQVGKKVSSARPLGKKVQRSKSASTKPSVQKQVTMDDFNKSAGSLDTVGLFSDDEDGIEDDKSIDFYLKIPTRELRQSRVSDLRKRFRRSKSPKKYGSSIIELTLKDRPKSRRNIL